MKNMTKVIAAMMIMAITTTMPAMAGNRNHTYNDKKDHTTVVTRDKKTHHPDIRTCTIKVGRNDSHRKIVAKAERLNGVKEARWNPRTRDVIISYDANKTTSRYIRHYVA